MAIDADFAKPSYNLTKLGLLLFFLAFGRLHFFLDRLVKHAHAKYRFVARSRNTDGQLRPSSILREKWIERLQEK